MAVTKQGMLTSYNSTIYKLRAKHAANIEEYVDKYEYINYKGVELMSHPILMMGEADISIHTIPTKILEDYYNFIVMEDDCNAWLRMWNNTADTPEDFQAGLPGINGEIQCDTTKKLHDELRTSPAYREMEVRYLASKLLKGN